MPIVLVFIILIHVLAVLAKLRIFFAIPRLKSVEAVKIFQHHYRKFERIADGILWVTGISLLAFAKWKMLQQTWMLVSIALYIIVFLAIRFALTRELEKISHSNKILASEELKRLRTNNWCVGVLAVVFLGVIAYLMMTKPT